MARWKEALRFRLSLDGRRLQPPGEAMELRKRQIRRRYFPPHLTQSITIFCYPDTRRAMPSRVLIRHGFVHIYVVALSPFYAMVVHPLVILLHAAYLKVLFFVMQRGGHTLDLLITHDFVPGAVSGSPLHLSDHWSTSTPLPTTPQLLSCTTIIKRHNLNCTSLNKLVALIQKVTLITSPINLNEPHVICWCPELGSSVGVRYCRPPPP